MSSVLFGTALIFLFYFFSDVHHWFCVESSAKKREKEETGRKSTEEKNNLLLSVKIFHMWSNCGSTLNLCLCFSKIFKRVLLVMEENDSTSLQWQGVSFLLVMLSGNSSYQDVS